MRSRTMNMSQGRPLALLAVFALPLLIGNLFQQAYNLADSIIVGRFIGAGRLDRVRKGLADGMLAMAAFSAVMFVVIQLLGPNIMAAFVRDEAVVALGGRALRLTSWFYVFLGTIYMTRGTLNGVGDTLFSFINGLIEMLCRILMPMGLTLIPALGVWAIWWTAGLTWAVSATACLLRYLSWRGKRAA